MLEAEDVTKIEDTELCTYCRADLLCPRGGQGARRQITFDGSVRDIIIKARSRARSRRYQGRVGMSLRAYKKEIFFGSSS